MTNQNTKQLKEYAKEFARKGGQATLKKYGREHFKKLRAKVGKVNKNK